MRLSDSLAKYLGQLGFEKRKPPAEDLTAYIERRYTNHTLGPGEGESAVDE